MANEEEKKGLISDIERFAIHDGPGIRTLVFMKGCPLRCLWCDNPESQRNTPELAFFPDKCVGCGRCLEVCPEGAIYKYGDEIKFDRRRCKDCGKCAQSCPSGARKLIGNYVTADWLLGEIMKDYIFYQKSGGGVTIGGGEPLSQPDFVRELLRRCRQQGIATAIETCGYGSWEQLEKILEYVDLVLFDIKHIDPERHSELTGVSNELILENAQRISTSGFKMTIRIPFIPGINDTDSNIASLAKFITALGNTGEVDLLPYHRLGETKYEQLGRKYKLRGILPPEQDSLQPAREILERYGLKVRTGG
jgi:pyruvate formate lyase activating enzyme